MVNDRPLADLLVQATIFSIPFGVFSIETGFVNVSPPNLLIIITVTYLGAVAVLQEELRLSKVQVFILALLSVVIVLILVTLFAQSGSPRRLITYIGYSLLTAILFLYIDSITDAKQVLRAAFLSAVAISLLTIVHSVTYPVGLPFGSPYIGQRTVAGVTVPFQRTQGLPRTSYGAFGMTLMVGTPYYFYVGLKKRSGIILFSVSLVLLAVLILQSRSTWVATGLMMFIVTSGYTMKEYGEKANIAYLSGVVFPVILLLPVVFETLVSSQSRSFYSRIEQYQVAVDLLQSNPIMGVGLGNVDQFYTTYAIHSGFLRIGVEAGAIVLLAIVIIWVTSVLSAIRGLFSSPARNDLGIGILASIVVMIIEANFAPGFSKAPWIVLAIGIGIYSVD